MSRTPKGNLSHCATRKTTYRCRTHHTMLLADFMSMMDIFKVSMVIDVRKTVKEEVDVCFMASNSET